MAEATRLLVKFSQRLFKDEATQTAFIDRLTHPQPLHPCIVWCRAKPLISPFDVEPPLSWQPDYVDRLALGQQPGKHPLHDEGAFYCLDFSSVFAISPVLTVAQPVDLLIDLCASPGGKSIVAWKALHPQQLISNEVIGKRLGALLSNLRRCQIQPASVTHLDPEALAEAIPQTAQVVIVDAPCTGQSLLAKGEKAPGCFHPVTINANANRQKRILANAAQLVAGKGYLAYMTCAYSPEENEQVAEWFLKLFPQFAAIAVPHLELYQSHLSSFPCYRLFPQAGLGAGAFTVLFHNQSDTDVQSVPNDFWQRSKAIVINSAFKSPA